MKISFRNKKGIDLSINMLVIVAMAIFALFLIVGFVLGGFSYFKGLFGGVSSTPGEVAKLNCQRDLLSARNVYGEIKVPVKSKSYANLCVERYDIDLDGDGLKGVDKGTPIDPEDRYFCEEYVDTKWAC